MILNNQTKEILLSAHRTWIQSDLMYIHFKNTMTKTPKIDKDNVRSFFISAPGVYMLFWYALLFATCEILKEHDLIPRIIEGEVNKIYDSLRRIRNAAFHAQKKYWSPKYFEIMAIPDSVKIIKKIHHELDLFFLDLFRKSSELS